jgi:hypothetical protein
VKKLLYLFLALLLPGLVFVFLKYQGSNRFDIPVYYEKGVEEVPGICATPPPGPYHVDDSVWSHLESGKQRANVIIFPTSALDIQNIARSITEEIGEGVSFTNGSSLSIDSLTRVRWNNCAFLMTSPRQTVLLDDQGRIRGYYDLHFRDEADRLRVELKILLEQY